MLLSAIIATLSTLIPFGFGVYRWQALTIRLRLITGYCLFSIICDTIGITLALNGYQNIYVTSLFAVGQLLLLGLYFINLLLNKPHGRFVYYILVLLSIFFAAITFSPNNLFDYSVSLRILASVGIIIILLSLLAYYVMIKRLSAPRIELDPDFWIVSALLIRMSGSVVLALSPDIINNLTWSTLWIYFNNVILIFMNLIFAFGIYLGTKAYSNE